MQRNWVKDDQSGLYAPDDAVPDFYAFMEAGSYIDLHQDDVQAIEDVFDDANGKLTIINIFQACTPLGGVGTFRGLAGISTAVDTDGSFYNIVRYTSGEYRILARTDAGTPIFDSTTLGPVVFDGNLQFTHLSDLAVAFTATAKVALNGAAFVNLAVGYNRTALGVLERASTGAEIRGPSVSAANSCLGWNYLTAVIKEDTEADRTALYNGFNSALSDPRYTMKAACAGFVAAVRSNVTESNIIYLHEHRVGQVPLYGKVPTYGGVKWSLPGVQPP